MDKIGIFYGSTTGNSESVAKKMQESFEPDKVELFDVSNANASDLEKFSNIILGASTWGAGDLQDDFESFLDELGKANLNGKRIAIFGTGDQFSFSDTFVDAIGIIYETIETKGCEIIGHCPKSSYNYSDSRAEIDGVFVGLPLDENNESEKTTERIENWMSILKRKFI